MDEPFDSLRSLWVSSFQKRQRIDHHPVLPDFKVKVGAGRASGTAHPAQDLTTGETIAGFDVDLA